MQESTTITQHYPILEYDAAAEAVIEPSNILKRNVKMPERCVLCFFADVIKNVCAEAEVVGELGSEIGINPIYRLDVSETLNLDEPTFITVVHPGVGAPLSAAYVEELIAYGAKTFIACGGAGALNRELVLGHLVVPTAAVRDEGTSYHYLPPGREVNAASRAVEAVEATLSSHNVPFVVGKTWTTDGIYRETRARINRRRDEGCITVEMEAAAFFAVAQFREVEFGQILYCGDDLSGDVWDHRDWQRQESTRTSLFWLAVESILRM